MSPGRSLLREEIRDTLIEAMSARTKAKHEASGMVYDPTWIQGLEIYNAATDLAAVLWDKYFEPESETG